MPPWGDRRPATAAAAAAQLELDLSVHRVRWLILLATVAVLIPRAESACESGKWWDAEKDSCIECKTCSDQELVLRPCQQHMDTVCGTVSDLGTDFRYLARTEARRDRHWKEERRKDADSNSSNTNDRRNSVDDVLWDWQAASLLLAVIGCLLFFIAAAVISINHARQWRRIEKHFDADMEELSAQLMARLACMQNLENGSLIVDDTGRFRNSSHPIEVRCVYLEQLLAGKDSIKHQGPGNVYIEENNERQHGARLMY